jgi:hypothetical protein
MIGDDVAATVVASKVPVGGLSKCLLARWGWLSIEVLADRFLH